MTTWARAVSILLTMWLWTGSAQAGTCSFDGATGVLSISTQGGFATLKVVSGALQLNGVPSGAATTTSTSRIVVSGVDNDIDKLTLIGTFAPGRNDVPETDDPEIEFEFPGYTDSNDWIYVTGNASCGARRGTTPCRGGPATTPSTTGRAPTW